MFNGYRIFLICSLLVMLKSQHGVINNMAPHIGNPEFQRNPHHMENNFQPPHPGNAQDIPNHHSHHHRHNNHHPKGAQEIQQGFTNNSNSIFSGYMGTIYEILMVFFFFNFIYNCFYGNKQNDKNALIWYNANKQYFEERYKQIGLNDNYEEDTLGESLKELKDNATDLM